MRVGVEETVTIPSCLAKGKIQVGIGSATTHGTIFDGTGQKKGERVGVGDYFFHLVFFER